MIRPWIILFSIFSLVGLLLVLILPGYPWLNAFVPVIWLGIIFIGLFVIKGILIIIGWLMIKMEESKNE